tara:strand:+ start:1547 stop:1654 length:108 start_codon:yes stop_codon:yes gene_type:complete
MKKMLRKIIDFIKKLFKKKDDDDDGNSDNTNYPLW